MTRYEYFTPVDLSGTPVQTQLPIAAPINAAHVYGWIKVTTALTVASLELQWLDSLGNPLETIKVVAQPLGATNGAYLYAAYAAPDWNVSAGEYLRWRLQVGGGGGSSVMAGLVHD